VQIAKVPQHVNVRDNVRQNKNIFHKNHNYHKLRVMENSIDYLNKNLVLIQVSVGIIQLFIRCDEINLVE